MFTKKDVGPRCIASSVVNGVVQGNPKGEHVELSDKEKEEMIKQWNADEESKPARKKEAERETKIQDRMELNARTEAIAGLERDGEI